MYAIRSYYVFTANGLVAGLVAICSGTDVVSPVGALVIGLLAGIQVPIVYKVVEKIVITSYSIHYTKLYD